MEAIDDQNAKKVFCMKIARRIGLCLAAKELIQPFDRREIFISYCFSYTAACATILDLWKPEKPTTGYEHRTRF